MSPERADDLSAARRRLLAENHTCVLCRGDEWYASDLRGIEPLLRWLCAGTALSGFSAADRIVGKAAALLYCLLNVRAVYAPVMSDDAVRVLTAHGIRAVWRRRVPMIVNRAGTGPCPMDAATAEIEDPAAAADALRAAFEKTKK